MALCPPHFSSLLPPPLPPPLLHTHTPVVVSLAVFSRNPHSSPCVASAMCHNALSITNFFITNMHQHTPTRITPPSVVSSYINTHQHASHHRPSYRPPPRPPPSTPPFPIWHRAADRWLPERQSVLHLRLQRRRHSSGHLRLCLQRKWHGAPGLAAAPVLRRHTRFFSFTRVVRQGGHCLNNRPQVLRPYYGGGTDPGGQLLRIQLRVPLRRPLRGRELRQSDLAQIDGMRAVVDGSAIGREEGLSL